MADGLAEASKKYFPGLLADGLKMIKAFSDLEIKMSRSQYCQTIRPTSGIKGGISFGDDCTGKVNWLTRRAG